MEEWQHVCRHWFFPDKAMQVLGQELHEKIEEDSVKTIIRNFAVYVKRRYGPVVFHQSLIAFLEDWRDGSNFPVFWRLPVTFYVPQYDVQNDFHSLNCLLIEDGWILFWSPHFCDNDIHQNLKDFFSGLHLTLWSLVSKDEHLLLWSFFLGEYTDWENMFRKLSFSFKLQAELPPLTFALGRFGNFSRLLRSLNIALVSRVDIVFSW